MKVYVGAESVLLGTAAGGDIMTNAFSTADKSTSIVAGFFSLDVRTTGSSIVVVLTAVAITVVVVATLSILLGIDIAIGVFSLSANTSLSAIRVSTGAPGTNKLYVSEYLLPILFVTVSLTVYILPVTSPSMV